MQLGLDLGHELIIDLFAGGGGASAGIERGIGRAVDIAVNHDPEAIALHQANHPHTEHYCESVFRVNPTQVTRQRPVGLLWASPDCTHFSSAKGAKPVCSRRRALAWVVVKWARRTRPRVILCENIEDFLAWGPLDATGRPCQERKGQQFDAWIGAIRRLGYRVEYRLLRGCDYGAPTTRQRLFLIARRDGLPIRWPAPTHGPADSPAVRRGELTSYRTAGECIDWALPVPSVFARRRPLVPNTLRRIARGIERFVLRETNPFSVPAAVGTADAPIEVAFLAKHYGGNYQGAGSALHEPVGTITTRDHHALVVARLTPDAAFDPAAPGHHAADVAELMRAHHGLECAAQEVRVRIEGKDYVLTDIAMRMLAARELYRGQGFPEHYVIDRGPDGRRLSQAAQVRMCGNSVCPPMAEALVRANFAHEGLLPRSSAA